MRTLVSTLALVSLLAPQVARAGSLVEGYTTVDVEERGFLRVAFTVAGPEQGPLKVGFLERRRLVRAVEVPFEPLAAGEYRLVTVRLRAPGRTPAGTYEIAVDGAAGRVGDHRAVIVRGPDNETFLGEKKKVLQSFFEKRDAYIPLAWVDDTAERLAVDFFLRLGGGDDVDVVFRRGKKEMCRDHLAPLGAKGQVVRVQAYCRDRKGAEGARSDEPAVVVEDDSHMYDNEIDDDSVDIDIDAATLKNALSVKDAVSTPGRWRVEVRSGKRLRRVISFDVQGGTVRAAKKRSGPLKAALVKVVSP